MTTTVVHCKRAPYDIYIGRPSLFGNPFKIGHDGSRAEVIAKYEAWIQTQPALLAAIPTLRGKRLGCWCSPKPCHGTVLARLADAEPIDPDIEQWASQAPDAGPAEGETEAEYEARVAHLRAAGAEQKEAFRCPRCGKPGALASGGDRFHPEFCQPDEREG